MPRKLLRPKEAQARLGIKHTKFYELVDSGKLRLVRISGKAVAVLEDDLDAFIDALPSARPEV
jgi:excisionase family DNA binding protein